MTRHLTRKERPHATKIAIVLDTATGYRRRVLDLDDDRMHDDPAFCASIGQIPAESTVHPAETLIYLTHAEYDAFNDAHALNDHCARKLGFQQAPDINEPRHVIVDTDGNVVAAHMLHPACGDSGEHFGKGFALVKHQTADVGWKHANGVLTDPNPPTVDRGAVKITTP